MENDIRWVQRLDNYSKAMHRLEAAVKIIAAKMDFGEEIDDLLLPYNFDISIFSMLTNRDLTEHIVRVGIPIYSTNRP